MLDNEKDVEVLDGDIEDNLVVDEEMVVDNSEENQEITNEEESQSDGDEVVVLIGDEAPPREDEFRTPEWVRELRKTNRELLRQNKELQSKMQASTSDSAPRTIGKEPTLEDFDYDADKFKTALRDWFEQGKRIKDEEAKRQAEAADQQKAWQARLDAYATAKTTLKVKDFEDAELVAQESFNTTQQGIIVQGADNPALVIYAVGKNPKKAKELADIKDPVKFAFAVAKLEKELKVTNRKSAPPPEKVVSGTGRVSGAVDSTLDRLREEAARTGDMTKVIRYKAQKRK